MPKPIKRFNMDAEVMAEVERATQAYLDQAPAEIGPPADAMKMNDDEAVDWFDWADPAVTPEMLAQATAQAADADEADRIATILKHPRRFEMLGNVSQDPEEQAKAANRYRRLSDQRKAQMAPPEMPIMQQPQMGQPAPLVPVSQPQGPPPAEMFAQPQVQPPAPMPGQSWLGG